jgi:hypothetical protein
MFKFDNTKPLEYNVREYLTYVRRMNPTNFHVQTFQLYTDLSDAVTSALPNQNLYRFRDAGLPVAAFNKTIGDMKKAGIVGTTKNSQEVFLSDIAWDNFIVTKKNQFLEPGQRQPITVDLDRYITKGVFKSTDEIKEKLVQSGIVVRDSTRVGITGDIHLVMEWLGIRELEFDKKAGSTTVTEGGK